MNKNLGRGLAVGVILAIILVVLYVFLGENPWQTGPSSAPGPTAGTAPAVKPAPATPESKGRPAALPEGQTVPPTGIAPLEESNLPAPQVTLPPPPEEKEHYGMLVGSYQKYPDAANMLARLKKQGTPAFIQRDPRDINRYQVWAGPFASRGEAQVAEKSLSATLRKPLTIEPIENPAPK
jgi:cell division septation protein DedD